MAMKQLIQCFGQLTVETGRLAGVQLCRSHQLFQFPRSALHTSVALNRKLDNRSHPPSREPSKKGRWDPLKKISELHPEYTTQPIPIDRTGGRGPNGRIWNHKRGGGDKRVFYMMDWVRGGETEGEPKVEKVHLIQKDQNRTGHIALVAAGEHKRWIIATQSMREGDLIQSTKKLSKVAVRANEGDSYPLGSLPVGTLVSCVEKFPDQGAFFARAAGTSAQLLRKFEDQCLLRLPSKREVIVSSSCVGTVGRVSNEDHDKVKFRKFGEKRWLGIRPRSGRWKRKTGRFGRKIKPPKKAKLYDVPKSPRPEAYRFTL